MLKLSIKSQLSLVLIAILALFLGGCSSKPAVNDGSFDSREDIITPQSSPLIETPTSDSPSEQSEEKLLQEIESDQDNLDNNLDELEKSLQ